MLHFNMLGLGQADVNLAPQVEALTSAGVDPDTAYQMALTTQTPTASETNQPGQTTAGVDTSAGNLYVGGVSTTTWLIGGVALLGALVLFSGKRR